MDRPKMRQMPCCCLECPPGSTAKHVPNPGGPGGEKCECVCDSYPEKCKGKEYLHTDPFGVWSGIPWPIPRLNCKDTQGKVTIVPRIELNGEPCSCLCEDFDPTICTGIVDAVGKQPQFPYTGLIDPRTCKCEQICTEDCESESLTQEQIDLINEYGGINGFNWPKNPVSVNQCSVPGMCCIPKENPPLIPDGSTLTECAAFCDWEQKKQCCNIRLMKSSLYGIGNLTFCCDECEECVENQTWNARCVPIPGCVKSEQSPPNPNINIESL